MEGGRGLKYAEEGGQRKGERDVSKENSMVTKNCTFFPIRPLMMEDFPTLG